MIKKLCAVLTAAVLLLTVFAIFTAAAEDEFQTLTIKNNGARRFDGMDYEFWKQSREGIGEMTMTGGGTFICEWTRETQNILFRMGKRLGSVKTFHEYGDMSIDYYAEHEFEGNVSYLTVYGWTQEPLMEYYIVENYGSYSPGKILEGTIEVDGDFYNVYTDTRVNQPSIEGTKTFPQIYSIRMSHERRTEGVIDISAHFRAWEELGLEVSGNLYEVTLCIEGYNTSGNARVYRNVLTIGDDVFGETEHVSVPGAEPEPDPESEPEEPDEPEPESEPVTEDNEADSNMLVPVAIAGGTIILGIGAAAIAVSRRKK